MNYWSNYPKFMVSLLKAAYGKNATKDNDFGYAWLPKVDGNYSWMYIFDDMYRGSSTRVGGKEPAPEGFITFGMNPVGIGPNSKKMIAALSKLKWMVVVENLRHRDGDVLEGPEGVRHARRLQDPDRGLPASGVRVRREGRDVHQLGALAAVEMEGARSSRAGQGPTRRSWRASSSPCASSIGRKAARIRAGPERVLELHEPGGARSRRGAEGDERQGARRHPRPEGQDQDVLKTAGQQLDGFGQLQDDGSTMCGNWLHSGVYTEAGNNAQRRVDGRPDRAGHVPQLGLLLAGQPPHHVQPRVGRRRGQALGSHAAGHRLERREVGGRRSRHQARLPARQVRRVHHAAEGVGRLFAPVLNDGPFPEHYEAIEAPVDNPLHPKVTSNPVTKKFTSDKDIYGTKRGLPDRLHDVSADRALPLLDQAPGGWPRVLNELQPGFFVEIPEALAEQKGIANGSKVKVTSARGSIEGVAMVTKRLYPLKIDGKEIWQIGFPIHWGYAAGDDGPHRPARQHADAVRDGPEHLDAGVQGLPRQAREGVRRRAWPHRASRSAAPPPPSGEAPPGIRTMPNVSKYIDTTTCIGCKACEVAVPGVERPEAGRHAAGRHLPDAARRSTPSTGT